VTDQRHPIEIMRDQEVYMRRQAEIHALGALYARGLDGSVITYTFTRGTVTTTLDHLGDLAVTLNDGTTLPHVR